MQRNERITGQLTKPARALPWRERWARAGLVALSAPMVLFLLLPILALALRVDPGSLAEHLVGREVAAAIRLSMATTAATLALTVVAGTPVAYIVARWRFRGRILLDTLLDLPMVLPPSVAGIALLLAFGRFGLVGRTLDGWGITVGFTTAAVVLAQTFVAAPFFVRAAAGAFARIDRDMEDAAADLGSGPWRTLRRVTLPLALPGLAAGMVLAWARALGEFGATIMFAGNFPGITRTMPLAIYSAFGAGDLDTAILLAAALLLASGLTLGLVRAVAGRTT